MSDSITVVTFLEQLTYYLKIALYVNKGTFNDAALKKCIDIYNKYKKIENSGEITLQDEKCLRTCIKKFNLSLKINLNTTPINISNKDNQKRMIYLSPHPSVTNDNLTEILEYSNKYKINVLSGVPLTFILCEGKYQNLLWQYTRSLFYITQILISTITNTTNAELSTDPDMITKQLLMSDSLSNWENITESLIEIEEDIKLSSVLSMDKFLNNSLINFDEINIQNAKKDVKKLLRKKGLEDDSLVNNLVDKISGNFDMDNIKDGNFMDTYMTLKDVAGEVIRDLRESGVNNPEQLSITMNKLCGVVSELVDDAGDKINNDCEIPDELKNVFSQVASMSQNNNLNSSPEEAQDNINKCLGVLSSHTGIDYNFNDETNINKDDPFKMFTNLKNI